MSLPMQLGAKKGQTHLSGSWL